MIMGGRSRRVIFRYIYDHVQVTYTRDQIVHQKGKEGIIDQSGSISVRILILKMSVSYHQSSQGV